MNNLPFDKPGQFYRGNLHTHSTRSDGRLTPEAVCEIYRDNGYDFLALTDHFLGRYKFPLVDTTPYRTADFVTLYGAELHAPATEIGVLWHILAVGLPLNFAPPTDAETGPQIAQRAVRAGAYVAVAHPAWYGLSEADVLSLGEVDAIEIYNATSEDHNDKADSWHIADVLLARGHRYTACATDDAHFNPERHDFARGWVMVRAPELTPDALLAALKAGHYYSSTGPAIYDVQVRNRTVTVYCSPAERVFVTGQGSQAKSAAGWSLTEARITLNHFDSPYCRVTVRDAQGRRAWTNPIWLA